MSLLEMTEVSKDYGQLRALKEVSLTLDEGEWLSIMGPSGSGKSTMMNIVGCLDTPTSGRVRLDGADLSRMRRKDLARVRCDTIGLIFQKFHLVGHLNALENVMVAQYYHSIPDESEAMEALERVGLAERAHHLPSQLSGGEQQRVCVARALINHPKLVLADEPTGNLDEDNERRVLELFRSLHDAGAALIVVTHDPKVAGLGQRQIVLNHGRVVASEVNPARAAVDGVDHGQVAAGELNRDQRRNEDREVALDEGRDGIRKGTRDGSRDEDREVALDERREATREEGREGTREVSHA